MKLLKAWMLPLVVGLAGCSQKSDPVVDALESGSATAKSISNDLAPKSVRDGPTAESQAIAAI
jgi:replication-associated recombination protein RarA